MDPAKTYVINLQTETKKMSNLDLANTNVINLQTETKKISNMDPAKTNVINLQTETKKIRFLFVSLLHLFWRGPSCSFF
jgi:hypothetical protein